MVQEHYSLVNFINSFPLAYILADLQGNIEFVNEPLTSLLGFGEFVLLESNLFDHCDFSDTSYDDLEAYWNQFVETGKSEKGRSFQFKNCDGQKLWLALKLQRIAFNGHDYVGVIVQDVTEKKLSEEALYFVAQRGWALKGEVFLENMVQFLGKSLALPFTFVSEICSDGMACVVAMYDNGEYKHSINYELKGTPCEQVLNANCCHFPTNVQELFPQDHMLIKMGVDSYMGLPLVSSEGQAIGLIGIMDRSPFKSPELNDKILNIVAVRAAHQLERLRVERQLEEYRQGLEQAVEERTHSLKMEIIEREKIEVELKKATEKAIEGSRAKSEFLANMSHEIRTPMNAILGFSELLQGSDLSIKQRQYVSNILTSGKSLLTVINDILDLSKIEAGKMELKYGAVSIPAFINDLRQLFEFSAREAHLEFEIQVDAIVPETLILDETRVRQIMINLIGNALKFTHEGEVKVRVGIEGENVTSKIALVFEVEDTGIGIDESAAKVIFEPFEQAKGHSRKSKGTGLGLAICQRLATMMHGQITVKSVPGKGSLFALRFDDVEVAAVRSRYVGSEFNYHDEDITFEAGKILIVDDIEYNRELIKGFLEDSNVELLEAANGREAVDIALTDSPDVILMDMKMPVMDGREASGILKEKAATQQIPIIAVTASAMKREEDELKRLCDGFITKPIKMGELFKLLAQYLVVSSKMKLDLPADSFEQRFLSCCESDSRVYSVLQLAVPELSCLVELGALSEIDANLLKLMDAEEDKQGELYQWLDLVHNAVDCFDIDAIRRYLSIAERAL